jgi:DNA primase
MKKIDTDQLKKHAGLRPYKHRLRNLTRVGKGYTACCPLHQDTNPSFALNQKEGVWLWHCFPCQRGGDCIKLVMEMDTCDFLTAIRIISEECGIVPRG